MTTVWMVWVRDEDGYTWLEAAWTDDQTSGNHAGWTKEIKRVRRMCLADPGYSYRIQEVKVPGVNKLFETPTVIAEA